MCHKGPSALHSLRVSQRFPVSFSRSAAENRRRLNNLRATTTTKRIPPSLAARRAAWELVTLRASTKAKAATSHKGEYYQHEIRALASSGIALLIRPCSTPSGFTREQICNSGKLGNRADIHLDRLCPGKAWISDAVFAVPVQVLCCRVGNRDRR